MDLTMEERFLVQMQKTDGGCWLWTGFVGENGYGTFAFSASAHRWSYQHFVGPISEGHQVDHTCHNADLSCRGLGPACPHRRCVNPAHLEAVLPSVNIKRALGERTHCINGHELTPENTRLRSYRTTRECRTCIAEWSRRSRARAAQRGVVRP